MDTEAKTPPTARLIPSSSRPMSAKVIRPIWSREVQADRGRDLHRQVVLETPPESDDEEEDFPLMEEHLAPEAAHVAAGWSLYQLTLEPQPGIETACATSFTNSNVPLPLAISTISAMLSSSARSALALSESFSLQPATLSLLVEHMKSASLTVQRQTLEFRLPLSTVIEEDKAAEVISAHLSLLSEQDSQTIPFSMSFRRLTSSTLATSSTFAERKRRRSATPVGSRSSSGSTVQPGQENPDSHMN